MNKYEFTKALRQALTGRISPAAVDSHVAYYEDYIDTRIRKGETESEVLAALGDPRLIARTIIDSSGEESSANPGPSPRAYAGRETDDNGSGRSGGIFGSFGSRRKEAEGFGESSNTRFIRIPSWLMVIFGILVIVLLFKVVGLLITALAPLIFAFFIITWILRFFRRR